METNNKKATIEEMLGVVEDAQRELFKRIVDADDDDQEENITSEYEELIFLKQELINARYETKRLENKVDDLVKKFCKIGLDKKLGGDDKCQK